MKVKREIFLDDVTNKAELQAIVDTIDGHNDIMIHIIEYYDEDGCTGDEKYSPALTYTPNNRKNST